MRAREFTQKLVESKLSYIGNCTDDDVIEDLFGDATGFAQLVDEHGDDFELDDLVVKYDPESDIHSFYYKQQGVAEGIARGPKEKALYELLYAWLAFTSLKATKIPNDAIDSNGHKELKSMQQHYLGPVINGMTMGEILKGDLWQNPKVIPHLLKYIYQGIPYIEERIKRFVRPSEQGNYLGDVGGMAKIKKLYKEVVAQYSQSQQGVKEDSIDEMALSTYKTMGDFSKPGPFTGADKKLVPHPKNIEKATQFFEQTPFDFRLFFSHLKGTGKYSEHGPMSPDQIRQVFGQDSEEIINGSEDAITVVYVGNKGDAKVMLTPWMMAHRFGHAINAGARNKNWTAWGEAEKYFFQTVNNLLDEHYGKVPATKPPGRNILFQLTPEYNALFNAMGTQRSSKSGQIRRPYEFLYELFAQYLGTGKVTLNPLPTNLTYGRRVFGNPTKYMNIKPEYRDEGERKQAADSLAYTMELLFNDVLSDSVGKIFVM